MGATVVIGQQGRLVIPADIRAALGLVPGDALYLELAGNQLRIHKQQEAASGLRGFLADREPHRSLVEELLAERRAEASAG